jgi:hypothetical protein
LGTLRDNDIPHLDRRTQLGRTLPQYIGQTLTCMLGPVQYSAICRRCTRETMPLVNTPVRSSAG